MTRIGLTGGIASGKSTVASILRELGAVVIDADRIARDVVEPGTPGLQEVVDELGPGVLTAPYDQGGALDRQAVARLVFADPDARRRLEAVVHPRVFAEAERMERAASPGSVVVHDIPLLVESLHSGVRSADDFDAVIVVDVPEDLQVARLTGDRGWTEAEARSRIDAQASREDRLAVATHVVRNTGTHEDLRERVTEVLDEITHSSG